jgi:hypothetical protein
MLVCLKTKVLASTIARLYFASEHPTMWVYQDKVGAAVLAREKDSQFSFHLVDLKVSLS